jgi:hypothetical protein
MVWVPNFIGNILMIKIEITARANTCMDSFNEYKYSAKVTAKNKDTGTSMSARKNNNAYASFTITLPPKHWVK